MTGTRIKKTARMRLLERLHPGLTIDQIVKQAVEQNPTTMAAAVALDISLPTLRDWCELFGIGDETPTAGAGR